jgi:hypothetical protein
VASTRASARSLTLARSASEVRWPQTDLQVHLVVQAVSTDTAEAAWDDGAVCAINAVRAAITEPDCLATAMHALLIDMQEKHGPDGLLTTAMALAWIAGNAVQSMAALADRPVSDVLDEAEMSAISSAAFQN